MRARIVEPAPIHKKLIDDVVAAIRKYDAEMDKVEILAVLSNVLGKVIAMQDQRKYSSDAVMAIVSRNIEIGNEEVLQELTKSQGSA